MWRVMIYCLLDDQLDNISSGADKTKISITQIYCR